MTAGRQRTATPTTRADKRRRFHGGVVFSDDEVLSIINTQMARQESDLELERRFMAAMMRHNRQREVEEAAEAAD